MMGRPRKEKKTETTPEVIEEQKEEAFIPLPDDELVPVELKPNPIDELLPKWDFEPQETRQKAIVRTQVEFNMTVPKEVKRDDKFKWSWRLVLELAEKIKELTEGEFEVNITIPPHVKRSLES